MKYQPSAIIPGGCALLTFAIVIFAALGIRIYDSASNYMQTPANKAPTNQRDLVLPTPLKEAPRSGDGDSVADTPQPTPVYTPTPTPATPTPTTSTSNSSRSSYTWRVKGDADLRSEPSDYGESIETLSQNDGLIMNYRKSDTSKWYNVTTEAGNTGWIDGNYIEESSQF